MRSRSASGACCLKWALTRCVVAFARLCSCLGGGGSSGSAEGGLRSGLHDLMQAWGHDRRVSIGGGGAGRCSWG